MANVVANESYVIKERQFLMAACIAAFAHDLGAKRTDWLAGAWDPSVAKRLVDPSHWRVDDPVMFWNFDGHDKRKSEYVSFPKPFYSDGNFQYGDVELIDDIVENDDTQSYILDNSKSEVESTCAYERSVALENSVEHSVDKGMTFDVTSETTIKGSYAGIEAEQKIGAAYGRSFNDSVTKSESESESETISQTFPVPAGSILQLQISFERQRTKQDYKVDGILDSGVHLKLGHWWADDRAGTKYRPHDPSEEWQWPSLGEFQQFFMGLDTNYPSMEGYWSHGSVSRVRNGLGWLMHKDNRRVQTSGVKMRTLEKNAKLSIVQLHSMADAPHLPVVDLSNEAERDQWLAK